MGVVLAVNNACITCCSHQSLTHANRHWYTCHMSTHDQLPPARMGFNRPYPGRLVGCVQFSVPGRSGVGLDIDMGCCVPW